MKQKTRIGIVGIGGVGGFIGGRLANSYHDSDEIEIVFITRPSTGKVIREHGLKLIEQDEEKTIHPDLVASDGDNAGVLDVLICATKSYDLKEGLMPLADAIISKTLILPLLNGVDSREAISAMYPNAEVLNGCIYIVSRRIEPGIIRVSGGIHRLYFGSLTAPPDRVTDLQNIFVGAGINSHLSEKIESDVWEKFLFTAGMATSTSYFDETIGRVMANPEHKNIAMALVGETKLIADAKHIELPDDIVEKTIERMEKLPFEATSSMHSDFQKGGKTEYRSLTKYVADTGDELGIDTPTFDQIVADFITRSK